MKPELSIIIVSYNVRELLAGCLGSIQATCAGLDCEVVVADNASSDGSAAMVRQRFPAVRVIENAENLGFAKANNRAFEQCSGDYILLLNPDTVVKPNAVGNVLGFVKATPDCGLAGCRQVGADGKHQWSIRSFHTVGGNILWAFGLDRLFRAEHRRATYYRDRPFRIGYPTGAFLMVRREALEGMQLFNEQYFMYSEEPDLAMRLLRKGWHSYYVPAAEIVHLEGGSTGQNREAMFLQLQKSHLSFYRLYYSKPHALLLQWSWWLVIFNTWAVSSALSFAGMGRDRAALFGRALSAYPAIFKEIWRSA